MKEREGFSLIELILTIAIMAIVVGGSALGIAYLSQANSHKLSSQINSGLSELRSANMAKNEVYYMHLYCYDDTYYIKRNTSDTCAMDDAGLEIGTTNINVTLDGVPLNNNTFQTFSIRKKDGAFVDVDNGGVLSEVPKKIKVVDSTGMERIITLVKDTGKHMVE